MPADHNYYAILGVHPNASHEDIRRAFRKRAFATHPDRGGSQRRMQLLNEAWATLGDPDRRRAYDAQRQPPPKPAPPVKRPKSRPAKPSPRPPGPLPTLAQIMGAFVGHTFRAIENLAGPVEPPPKPAAKPKIIRCRRCGQRLRIKPAPGVQARCPKCRHLETRAHS